MRTNDEFPPACVSLQRPVAIAYGAPATQGIAAVIVYHAIAFWIPSLAGLGGYALLRRRLRGLDAATQRPTPSRRSVASSGTPPKYASSTCPKIGLAESA